MKLIKYYYATERLRFVPRLGTADRFFPRLLVDFFVSLGIPSRSGLYTCDKGQAFRTSLSSVNNKSKVTFGSAPCSVEPVFGSGMLTVVTLAGKKDLVLPLNLA